MLNVVEKVHIELEQRKEKIGNIWVHKTFICSNKNTHTRNCTCKPIVEDLIIEAVKSTIKAEISKIEYTDKELSDIYKQAEKKVNVKTNILKKKLKTLKQKLDNNQEANIELYKDRRENIITSEDYKIFYNELQKEKNEIMGEIFKAETEILEMEKGNVTIDYKEIRKLANEIISTENPSKELYSKLIEKIEFDSEKNIIVTLTFGEITLPRKLEEAV